MTIDFTKLPTGLGNAPFKQGGAKLDSWNGHSALTQYSIDNEFGAGYDVAAMTICTVPDSKAVRLLCLLNHAANFRALDANDHPIGDVQYLDLGGDPQLVTLERGTSAGIIRKVLILLEDVKQPGVYISTLGWDAVIHTNSRAKRSK